MKCKIVKRRKKKILSEKDFFFVQKQKHSKSVLILLLSLGNSSLQIKQINQLKLPQEQKMLENAKCQDHEKEFIFFYFGLEEEKQFYCRDCLLSLRNQKEIVKISEIKDIASNELQKLQLKQQQCQAQLATLQQILEEISYKQNQLNTIIQIVSTFTNKDIKYLIKQNILIEDGQNSQIFDLNFQEDTLTSNLLQGKFQFSKIHKNESIEFCDTFLIKQKKQTMNSLAVIEPELDQFQSTALYLKINRVCQSVAVGFCELNILVKHKYLLFNWDSLGHGCYLLSSGGYSYNSDYIDTNYKKEKGFSFKENQILKISYNPISKIVNFQVVNYPEKQFTMKINLDHVHACVYVSKPQDEIEIVQI